MRKIDALKKIMEGLQVLIDLESTSEPQKENKILNLEEKRREKESLKEDVIEVKEGKITNESLESMTYSDLKKLAKDFGIDDKGPKSALLKRLQESDLEVEVPEEETEIEEVEDGVKVTDLKEDAEEEIEEDIEDDFEEEDEEDTDDEDTDNEDEDEDEEVDEIEKRVMEAVEEMETEEIADILAEHGIKAKGKRQALIAKLIKAVEDGVIEFADDEEDSDFEIDLTDFDEDDLKAILEELGVKIPKKAKKKDLIDLIEDQDEEKVMQVIQELSEGDDEEDQEETEDVEDEENEVEYGVNDLNNPKMTKKRKKMLKAHIEETEDAIEEGEFSEEDFIDFLEENTEISRKKLEKKDLEELKDMYIDITAKFIDDGGNFIEDEEEEYTVNGVAYMNGEPIED